MVDILSLPFQLHSNKLTSNIIAILWVNCNFKPIASDLGIGVQYIDKLHINIYCFNRYYSVALQVKVGVVYVFHIGFGMLQRQPAILVFVCNIVVQELV